MRARLGAAQLPGSSRSHFVHDARRLGWPIAAQLACILSEAGRAGEARVWHEKAAEHYHWSRGILRRFADHAAEFWLDMGGNPDRARWLAMSKL
jgi:hypothetical protein